MVSQLVWIFLPDLDCISNELYLWCTTVESRLGKGQYCIVLRALGSLIHSILANGLCFRGKYAHVGHYKEQENATLPVVVPDELHL